MEKEEVIKLETDKQYVYDNMIITVTTDFDFTPILKITTINGELLLKPTAENGITVCSTRTNDD